LLFGSLILLTNAIDKRVRVRVGRFIAIADDTAAFQSSAIFFVTFSDHVVYAEIGFIERELSREIVP
jgi:hypothetical protein